MATLTLGLALLALPSGASGAIGEDCFGLDPTISGSPGNDFLVGTPGGDVISGMGGDDVLLGTGGNDVICGGDGNDLVAGGKGVDFVVGGSGADTIRGDAGHDWLFDTDPTVPVEPLLGLLPRTGDVDRDVLLGGPGTDLLAGEGGDDVLDGGSGSDFVHGLTVNVPLFIDLGRGMVWSTSGGLDSVTAIENAIGGTAQDVIIGTDGKNSLGGHSDSDRIFGGGGEDVIFATVQGSRLSGGGDDGDLLWINSPSGVRVDLPAGMIRALAGDRTADSIDGFTDVLATAYDDVIIGDDRANRFLGFGGNDRLIGGAGDDSLSGDGPAYLLGAENGARGGADLLDGGPGEDSLDGGPRKDGCIDGEKETSCELDGEPDAAACEDPDPDCTWPFALASEDDPGGALRMLVATTRNEISTHELDWMASMIDRIVVPSR